MTFLRQIILYINLIPVSGLRIDFEIIKNDKSMPNTSTTKIYNISDITRKLFANLSNVPFQITAGHLLTLAPLFIGRTKYVENKKLKKPRKKDGFTITGTQEEFSIEEQEEGVDTITQIQAFDDAQGLDSPVSVSIPAGGNPLTALTLMAATIKAPLANTPAFVDVFQNGFSFIGTASQCLDQVVKNRLKMDWFIQDGLLHVLASKQSKLLPPVALSPLNGLIGRVEEIKEENPDPTKMFDVYYSFRVIILPILGIGSQVFLTSKEFTGLLKIVSMRIVGSNYDTDFTMHCKGIKI